MSDKTGLIKKIPDKHYENYMRIVKDAETAYLNRDFIGAMHFMDKAAEVAFAVRGRDKLLFQSYYCLAKFTFEFINELKDFDADPGHIVYYAKKMVEYKYKEFFYMDAVRKRGHIQIHGIPLEDLIEKYNSSFPVFIYVLGKAYHTKVQHKMELAKTTSDFEMRQKLYASVLCEDAYPAFLLYSKHNLNPFLAYACLDIARLSLKCADHTYDIGNAKALLEFGLEKAYHAMDISVESPICVDWKKNVQKTILFHKSNKLLERIQIRLANEYV